MRCFIHNEAEAIATCRKCGKAMCAQCSAYSGHSGICPQCRKEEFVKERKEISFSLERETKSLFWYKVKAILFIWTIIYPLYALYMISTTKKEIETLQSRYNKLNAEINRLNESLKSRGTSSFA